MTTYDPMTAARLAKESFTEWTDSELEDRMVVLNRFEQGWDSKTLGAAMHSLAFPHGFDPATHPEDNLQLVAMELLRRHEGADD